MIQFSALIALLLILAPINKVATAQSPDDCGKFWRARDVFVGRLIKASRGRSKRVQFVNGRERSSNIPVLHLTFSVERDFPERVARPSSIAVECAACLSQSRPRAGERFLVYAYGIGSKGGYPFATFAPTPVSMATAELESLAHLTAPGTIAYDLNRVVAGIISGKAVALPKPGYPPVAKAAKASGSVTVAIILDPSGTVIRAEAVCGHPLLRAPSEEAAKKIRYSPTELNGKPVSMGGLVIYNFQLE